MPDPLPRNIIKVEKVLKRTRRQEQSRGCGSGPYLRVMVALGKPYLEHQVSATCSHLVDLHDLRVYRAPPAKRSEAFRDVLCLQGAL
jgi:hypothetical protein